VYVLSETTAPKGYNRIDDITFEVVAEHGDENGTLKITNLNGKKLTGEITFNAEIADGSLTTNVENRAGSELPSTGGTGTKLFYILGGLLAAGAAVLLVTKRRMKNF
jgi:LPXTG-motif cell wall-anchored protein